MMHNLPGWMRRVFQAWLRLILREQARWEGDAEPPVSAPLPKAEAPAPPGRAEEPSLADLVNARNKEQKHRAPARDEGNG